MQSLRPVVKAFCDAAETHASPVLRGSPLTDDERVHGYAGEDCAWRQFGGKDPGRPVNRSTRV